MNPADPAACGRSTHFSRRSLLRAATALGGAGWLTHVAEGLARAEQRKPGGRAKSVIVLWLAGGPSQLETFDPHPGTMIGGDTRAISTRAPGLQLAAGLPRLAEQMDVVSLVRSVTSKEGDHERATYNVKTGFRPDPTLVHPSLGAVLCHQQSDDVEIPRHVSILPGPWPARGGYLGDRFDAFKMYDPQQPIPDVERRVPQERFSQRVEDLMKVVEPEFARGRLQQVDGSRTLHRHSIRSALRMMSSEQLKAFDVSQESAATRGSFGDTAFGRGCLAAVRLIEVGVRCVEVTLSGWDSHIDNHTIQNERTSMLDPAFAALLTELRQRELLEQTVVVCGGEFGRTPRINPAGGRDHWPHGFSIALAGGGIHGGRVIGSTAKRPKLDEEDRLADVDDPRPVADVHATIFSALGVEFQQELETPVGRPMIICEGTPIQELLA